MNTDLIQAIHASPLRLVMAVTGGGSLAVSDLLTEPGASRTILEAVVPYGEQALVDFLSHKPEQFCSEKTARRMAMAAFVRAMRLAKNNILGVGCTCSLASDRPKKGEHRAHWAVQSADQTWSASVVFAKGLRSRHKEERLVADLIATTIATFIDGANHSEDVPESLQKLLRHDETVVLRTATAPRYVPNVLFGKLPACRILPGEWQANPAGDVDREELPEFLFPGSFDPMHRGHSRMLEIVRQKFGPNVRVALEIAVQNVDKPPMDYVDLHDRMVPIAQHLGMATVFVWLTQFALFAEKSDFFRDVTFMVGTDTLKRIAMTQYYCNDSSSADTAIDQLIENGCRFLCFARRNENGEMETADSLELPEKLRQMVISVPEDEFCDDISSTQLRVAGT